MKATLGSHPRVPRFHDAMDGDTDNRDTFSSIALHERMLADEVRLDAYHRAIAAHVKAGDTVLDVGTGSGVLAFFAAQRGAGKVYAIDHSEIIEVAKRVAEHNRITNVEFLELNSREFAPAEKLDHIVQEQIGWCLFEENMVATVVDLRNRVLKTGGRIIPNRFDLFIEPVQMGAVRSVGEIQWCRRHRQDLPHLVVDHLSESHREAGPDDDCVLNTPPHRLHCSRSIPDDGAPKVTSTAAVRQ